jgi:hypothetical protein
LLAALAQQVIEVWTLSATAAATAAPRAFAATAVAATTAITATAPGAAAAAIIAVEGYSVVEPPHGVRLALFFVRVSLAGF